MRLSFLGKGTLFHFWVSHLKAFNVGPLDDITFLLRVDL